MEPITEQRQVPGPVVYGYLLLTAVCRARRAALSGALAGYCEQHELTLGAVFTDIGDDALQAPGFTGLLDALATDSSYGMVIPARAHLGHGRAARSRLAVIGDTGRRLMVVRGKPVPAGARSPR
ncbi:MAG TPA: hypothetical protein VGI96_22255 [Streptosporangiaceae bacterium]|jgi:hypothetical protein